MTSPDLHPEDLIERDELGLVTASERSRLDAHVRQCVVCRLERMARSDFQREAEQASGGIEVRELIAELLAPTSKRRRRKSLPVSVLGRALIGAALALVAGLVAAAVRPPNALVQAGSTPAVNVSSGSPPRGQPVNASPFIPPVTPHSTDLDSDTGRSEMVTAPPQARRERSETSSGLASQVPAANPASVIPASTIPLPSLTDSPSASLLFESAAVARRSGNHSTAADLYRSLVRDYPESPEGRTALAIFGRMLMDDGDDDDALAQFDRYLQTKGVLEQDALVGRALALERVGRTADARETWSSLLRSYPTSAHADRARSHLAALEKH